MTPSNIPAVYKIVRNDFFANPAPVIDLMAAQGASPFHILVATILSARTRDTCTAKVLNEKLFPVVNSFDDLEKLSVDQIAELIKPVGFYRMKAEHLKKLPAVVKEKFGGRIPDTVEELITLPGVGRKTANLVVAVAFNKPAICVDVHVHRIMNRLGLLATDTPTDTEFALRKILPQEYWTTWNACFVSYGQRICTPRNPACKNCALKPFCKTAINA